VLQLELIHKGSNKVLALPTQAGDHAMQQKSSHNNPALYVGFTLHRIGPKLDLSNMRMLTYSIVTRTPVGLERR